MAEMAWFHDSVSFESSEPVRVDFAGGLRLHVVTPMCLTCYSVVTQRLYIQVCAFCSSWSVGYRHIFLGDMFRAPPRNSNLKNVMGIEQICVIEL